MSYCLSVIRLPRLTSEPVFFIDRLPGDGVHVRIGPFMVLCEKLRRMDPWVPPAEPAPAQAAKG